MSATWCSRAVGVAEHETNSTCTWALAWQSVKHPDYESVLSRSSIVDMVLKRDADHKWQLAKRPSSDASLPEARMPARAPLHPQAVAPGQATPSSCGGRVPFTHTRRPRGRERGRGREALASGKGSMGVVAGRGVVGRNALAWSRGVDVAVRRAWAWSLVRLCSCGVVRDQRFRWSLAPC